MKKAIFTMMLLMVAMIASAKDFKTVIFTTTPQMHCANCEARVKTIFALLRGVKEIKLMLMNRRFMSLMTLRRPMKT